MNKCKLKSLQATAYHEAGHAVMAWLEKVPFKYVTIIPDEDSRGHLSRSSSRWFQPDIDSTSVRARRRIEAIIQIDFAGWIAEKRFMGRSPAHWSHSADDSSAVDRAFDVCSSTKTAGYYLAYLYQRTVDALEVNWFLVQEVASALLERKRLNAREVKGVIISATEAAIRAIHTAQMTCSFV